MATGYVYWGGLHPLFFVCSFVTSFQSFLFFYFKFQSLITSSSSSRHLFLGISLALNHRGLYCVILLINSVYVIFITCSRHYQAFICLTIFCTFSSCSISFFIFNLLPPSIDISGPNITLIIFISIHYCSCHCILEV